MSEKFIADLTRAYGSSQVKCVQRKVLLQMTQRKYAPCMEYLPTGYFSEKCDKVL